MNLLGLNIFTKSGKSVDDISFLKTRVIANTTVVYLKAKVDEYIDEEKGAVIKLENKNISKWMADYRHKEYWCKPRFGEALSDIPNETQFLLYQTKDDRYGLILPVVSEHYKCTLKGNDEGGIDAQVYSWYDKLKTVKGLCFVYSEGDNPFEVVNECTRIAAELLGGTLKLRSERHYPKIFKYLGWCSWDAFEIRVCEDDLLAKCEEFKEKKVPVRWALIDDMWGEVRDFEGAKYENRDEMFDLMHASRLYSFEADPKRFPNGLKGCIEKLNDYGMSVGVWHPTTGYWAGIDKKGDIYKQYSDLLIKAQNGDIIPSFKKEKLSKYYDAFHSFLSDCGVEFVKVDNQSILNKYKENITDVGSAARDYNGIIDASAKEKFGNRLINCMGFASENMWNRPTSPIVRVSDDFLPENREWFSKHIMQCSYNSIVWGKYYFTDWDMWWTDDSQAQKNSLLRAVSGGPVYISDTLHRSRTEELEPICIKTGEILMCDNAAVPTKDCLFQNPVTSGKVLKLQNTANDCGIIAAFNLNKENKMVNGTVSPSDIDGIKGEEFAIYEHYSRAFKIVKKQEKIDISLMDNDDHSLFIIVPLINGNGVIGKTDKYISPKTAETLRGKIIRVLEKGEYAIIENRKLVFKKL